MQLSPNFTLAELTKSSTAIRRGIDNTPSAEHIANLRQLCLNILEPIRAHYGSPVRITSGYRNAKLNKAIGGSATSQHCFGQAADFSVEGQSNHEVCKWIRQNLKFDQLIYEFGESGWVHCSFDNTLRNTVISASKVNGKTKYYPGLTG